MSNDQTPPDDPEYRVGKGRPPQSAKWKKGQSGNKNGRPIGSRNFASFMSELLAARYTIPGSGKTRTMTGLELIARRLFGKASAGDLKAIQSIIAMEALLRKARPTAEIITSNMSAEDASRVYQLLMNGKR